MRRVIGCIGNSHPVLQPAVTVRLDSADDTGYHLLNFFAVLRPVVRGRTLLRSLRVRRQMRERKLHRHGGRTHQHYQPTDELSVSSALQCVICLS